MTYNEMTAFFANRTKKAADRDIAGIVADYAEDCVLESPTAGRVVGRAAVEQYYIRAQTAVPDARLEIDDLIIMGDHVAATGTISAASIRGLYLGGKPFRGQVVFLYVVRDHEIVHERHVYDFGGLQVLRAKEDLKTAAQIQQALLPAGRRTGVGFDVAAESIPCREIGGDFFDFFELPEDTFGLTLGDVAGKGPPAALMAAMLQGVFAARASFGGTPAETLDHANRILLRRAIEARFATVLYAVLRPDGRLTYCNAGHNPPFVVHGNEIRRLTRGGLVLGAFEHVQFDEESVQLDPGDSLVVFSDGITEAVNVDGEDFGDERLESLVQARRALAPAAILECVLDAVRQFSAGTRQADDLTCLVLRYTGTQAID